MHKDNQAATTGRQTGGQRSTEGDVIFVGRNSFHMIPAANGRPDDQTPWMTEATPRPSTDAFDAPEESMVLAPPEGMSLTETARIENIATQIAHFSEGPRRRAVPIWAVAAALIGGASITLSAQAVMRRPNRATTATNVSHATATATATHPLLPRALPIVAPSTLPPPPVALLPESRPPAPRKLQSVATAEKRRGGRNKPSAPKSSVEAPDRKRNSAVKWVDPFATSRPAIVATATARTGSTNRSTKTRWVDPFAD